jgi:hypothetical protein
LRQALVEFLAHRFSTERLVHRACQVTRRTAASRSSLRVTETVSGSLGS